MWSLEVYGTLISNNVFLFLILFFVFSSFFYFFSSAPFGPFLVRPFFFLFFSPFFFFPSFFHPFFLFRPPLSCFSSAVSCSSLSYAIYSPDALNIWWKWAARVDVIVQLPPIRKAGMWSGFERLTLEIIFVIFQILSPAQILSHLSRARPFTFRRLSSEKSATNGEPRRQERKNGTGSERPRKKHSP